MDAGPASPITVPPYPLLITIQGVHGAFVWGCPWWSKPGHKQDHLHKEIVLNTHLLAG